MVTSSKKKNVELVLASGGARGLAHIGVIRELERMGYNITSVSGSSIGALIGGVYVSGKLEDFSGWVCDLDQVDVFELMDFTFTGQGFIKGEKLFNQIKPFISDTPIEKLSIPFAAVAADLVSRKEIVFKKGSLHTAIRASIAIPSIITPVILDNMVLVDGGVFSPIPAEVIDHNPDNILVICDINVNKPYLKPTVPKRPKKEHEYTLKRRVFDFIKENTRFISNVSKPDSTPGYLEVVNKTFDIMQDSICLLTKKNYHPDYVIEISRDAATTFEFYRGDELIEAGRLACIEAFANNKTQ
jgi:NTE family protein